MQRFLAYNLVKDIYAGLITDIVGRDQEIIRMKRILNRQYKNNVVISGASGVGKTALAEGFIVRLVRAVSASHRQPPLCVKLDARQLAHIAGSEFTPATKEYLYAALGSLKEGIVIIDNFEYILEQVEGTEWKIAELLQPFFNMSEARAILIMNETSERALFERVPECAKHCDVINIAAPSDHECEDILTAYASVLYKKYAVKIDRRVIPEIIRLAKRLPSHEAAFPERGLHLFDEALSACSIANTSVLTVRELHSVCAERRGSESAATLSVDKKYITLEQDLKLSIIGQDAAVSAVAHVMRRSALGLRNPARPLGSFLFLGPSGVGKTELAKVLARRVFERDRAFIRLDMSEFGEAHMVQRLIGSPPGFVGYEAGGQLTSQVLREPYALILLDEIEKAHPKVFDIFLQILDDGRLTDGHGQTVDFTQTIIIMTSNIGIEQIVNAYRGGRDAARAVFIERELMPLLSRSFRLEFLNRFDQLVVFNPLSSERLTDIALLEMKKIEERLAHHHIHFTIKRDDLHREVVKRADPRFGARPVKRFVEDLCERYVEKHLMKQTTSAV